MRLKHAVAVAAAFAATCASQAMAAPYADLRNIGAQANWSTTPDDATLRYNDSFNSNDPQTGGSYLGGYVAPSPLYSVSGSVTGAETLPSVSVRPSHLDGRPAPPVVASTRPPRRRRRTPPG
jgi:hypothetical protein